jgi:hypothetical protein
MFQKSVSAQDTSGAPTHWVGRVPNQGEGKQSVLAPDDRGNSDSRVAVPHAKTLKSMRP